MSCRTAATPPPPTGCCSFVCGLTRMRAPCATSAACRAFCFSRALCCCCASLPVRSRAAVRSIKQAFRRRSTRHLRSACGGGWRPTRCCVISSAGFRTGLSAPASPDPPTQKRLAACEPHDERDNIPVEARADLCMRLLAIVAPLATTCCRNQQGTQRAMRLQYDVTAAGRRFSKTTVGRSSSLCLVLLCPADDDGAVACCAGHQL